MRSMPHIRMFAGFVILLLAVVLNSGCGGGSSSSGGSDANSDAVQADAGLIVAVRVGETVTLDGSASATTLSDPLSYSWSFTSKPYGSKAVLQNSDTATPSFVGDVVGSYMVQLTVRSGSTNSQRAIALVEVSNPGDHLTGIHVHIRYSSRCEDCHDGRYSDANSFPFNSVPAKSSNHIATSNMCEACHTTFGFNLARYTDHQEVMGTCSSCHATGLAVGKSEFHIATTAECTDCHNTVSFLEHRPDGSYDHSNVTIPCTTCHNGKTAVGKYEGHAETTTDCVACHTTSAFNPAHVDHSTIEDNCGSCHNGRNAVGQTEGHPFMAVDCGVCHNITTFSRSGFYNHRLVSPSIMPCLVCHEEGNTIGARSKSDAVDHPLTASDCGRCHGLGGGNFANAIYDHTNITDGCSVCHVTGSDFPAAPVKHANHMLTDKDCSACHVSGSFAFGVFDHDPAIVNPPVACSSCHNGEITAGKHINHIPTTDDCRLCHFSTTSFKGVVVDHSAITDNCASCHDGGISIGKDQYHLGTARDCSVCHSNQSPLTFAGATYDHADPGVSTNCASCHNGFTAMAKVSNHIPSLTECSQCHSDTTIPGGFANATAFPNPGVHENFTNGCEGCHVSRYFPDRPLIKHLNHVPTTQDCHFCHSNQNFADQAVFTHAGITGNCESCHSGNYFLSANAKGKAQAATQHPPTTADCGACHAIGKNFTDGGFDHSGIVDNCASCHGDDAPAYPVGALTRKAAANPAHVVTSQDCSICHIPGTFATAIFNHDQIVSDCGTSCHGGPSPVATIKPVVGHVETTDDCVVCHNTTAFAGARYDHSGIVDNCTSCHDNVIARGKHGTHVPTNDDCSVCHYTTGFIPGNFAHVGIVDNCSSCHDGVYAQGKVQGHAITDLDCGVCHNVTSFNPAVHQPVPDSQACDECHNGVIATGKAAKQNPPHIATTRDCRDCHTTATFIGGRWIHEADSANNCDSCHSPAGGARAKPTGHFATTVQCDACHSTNSWIPTIFSHASAGAVNYPGDHAVAPTCSACHGPVVVSPFVYPPASDRYAPDCAACHASQFEPVDEHRGGTGGTVEQNRDCSGGGRGCHKVTDNNFD